MCKEELQGRKQPFARGERITGKEMFQSHLMAECLWSAGERGREGERESGEWERKHASV